MVQNKELIDWFNNYFDNCYYVKHEDFPESIFMFYDKNYVRQLKLAKLEGKEIPIKIDITSVCLFEQDWRHNFFCCNYNLIWNYLLVNSFTYDDIQSFIRDRLVEHSKMSILIPIDMVENEWKMLEEYDKMSILTSNFKFLA